MTARRRLRRLNLSTRLRLLALPRPAKLAAMVGLDLIAIGIAIIVSFVVRYPEFTWANVLDWKWFWLIVPVAAIPVFVACGLYRQVIRYIGARAAVQILIGVGAVTWVIPTVALFVPEPIARVDIMVHFLLLATVLIGGSRFGMRWFFGAGSSRHADRVLVWGAGHTGVQLAQSLHVNRRWTPMAFVDDDPRLWGRIVHRLRCIRPKDLASYIKRKQIGTIILAIPSASQTQRRSIISRLEPLGIAIKTVPPMQEILSGRGAGSDIDDVPIGDLLGREPVPATAALLRRDITGRTVLVTGAGGSIGSELCRQVLSLKPKRVLLVERSEYALYSIERELRQRVVMDDIADQRIEIVPLLGSAGNRAFMNRLFSTWSVHTVYHAAAHKHVPIVEENTAEGVANNTLATWITADAANAGNVETFVLISTDKAVRPTNVMGASKRMAEMVLQSLMQRQRGSTQTRYSMVRFGNVLGSSGSVVPLFREQIRQGGPVTVTHPDITRFFMTVEEAVQLVIQAGSMADGGEVHILDMGQPVKILDLAKRMIQLSGLVVRSEDNPEGDISIEYLGLRPGEKLYEELLIGEDVVGTSHPRIMRGNETCPTWEKLEVWLEQLETACSTGDCATIRSTLNDAVEGYQPAADIHDLQWQASRHTSSPSAPVGRNPEESEHKHV
ncbi:MAG: polysaccharide biosynthesis protein [Phycisphaerales bacterium]|nr:polysaccharide biosynthesis protein [Phycisphaerales bacterium]